MRGFDMGDNRRRAAVAMAMSVVALLATPLPAQLKPKVRVLTNPSVPVPPECAEGTVAPPPRVEVVPAPVTASPLRGGLSTALRVVQQAAERDDYDAFKRALADARAATASYQRGGERDAAEDALTVYRDLERLWDYSQTATTGAFFSVDDPELAGIARRYAARPALGSMYASRETRQLVTDEASRRLSRLGIHVTSRTNVPRTAPTIVAEARPVERRSTPSRSTSRPAPRQSTSTPAPRHARATKPAPQPRAITPPGVVASHTPAPQPQPQPITRLPQPVTPPPATASHAPSPAPTPAPQPITRVPQPVTPPPVTTSHAPTPAPTPLPQPVAPPPITTATQPLATASPGATDTTMTETNAFSTATDATATTSSAPAPAPAPSGKGNLALRVIVVLIAIGLLVALFRASS
jgi:hypothetical protein